MSDLSAQVRSTLDAAVTAIGGSAREGQIEMAEAVANALTDRHPGSPTVSAGRALATRARRPGI